MRKHGRPHGHVSVARSGVGRGDVLWASWAAMRSPRADRRVLCTLRDALPVWDVGRRGLSVDGGYNSSAGICHVSQGSKEQGPTRLTELPLFGSENYFVSPLCLDSTWRNAGNFGCEACARESKAGATGDGPLETHLSRSISHAGSRRSNLGQSHHRQQEALGGGLDSDSSSSPIPPSYDSWDSVSDPTMHKFMRCETWAWGFVAELWRAVYCSYRVWRDRK